MNFIQHVFNGTGKGPQPHPGSLKTDAKKVASGGARQLPNRRPRPEQTRRKRMDGCRENGYVSGKET